VSFWFHKAAGAKASSALGASPGLKFPASDGPWRAQEGSFAGAVPPLFHYKVAMIAPNHGDASEEVALLEIEIEGVLILVARVSVECSSQIS